jgi:hypothetical protein
MSSPVVAWWRILTLSSAFVITFLPAAYCLTNNSLSESESELLYDWQFTANRFVLVTSPLRLTTVILFSNWTLAVIVLSDKRMGLSFTIAAGPRQSSRSQVRVPRDSWPHFIVSDSRLPQTGRPGPRVCIPQEQGGPVMPPGTGFSFRRLLFITFLHGPHRNTVSLSLYPFVVEARLFAKPLLINGCCILISRSLRGNGSTCYNIIKKETAEYYLSAGSIFWFFFLAIIFFTQLVCCLTL